MNNDRLLTFEERVANWNSFTLTKYDNYCHLGSSIDTLLAAQDAKTATVMQEERDTAQAHVKALMRAAQQLVASIGGCTCNEGFTIRKLTDPACFYHQVDIEISQVSIACHEGD